MSQPDFHSQAILQNIFLLENIQGGIVYSDYDPPFYLRYASEGMVHLSGYTRDELLSMQQMDLVHEDDIESLANNVAAQLAQGNTFEVEYRLKRKDGSFAYVLDRAKAVTHEGGQTYIHCLLTDITELKRMEQALRLSEEKYKIAMQQSGYAILEYDPATDIIQFSENYKQIFGIDSPHGKLHAMAGSNVSPRFVAQLFEAFNQSVRDRQSVSLELQVLTQSGRYVWYSLHLTPLSNAFGVVYAVVGCLQNIDVPKRRIEELTELAQKDGLTHTYNRAAMEVLINQQLESQDSGASGALIILDIDNFKAINDTLGHDAGDAILITIVEQIQTLLRRSDLFGRLGGDEFLIFVPDVTQEASIAPLAQRIVEHVRTNAWCGNYPVTVSLGVALCTTEGHTFKSLYKNADIALYDVKRKGRNGYSIFGPGFI